MMLELRPELVDESKIPTDGPAVFPAYDRYPTHPGLASASGVLTRAQGSSAEKGRWLIEDHVRKIADLIEAEFGGLRKQC